MLRVQGQCGDDGVTVPGMAWGRWRRGLGDDDSVMGSGMARGRCLGGQRHHVLEDGACVVHGITDSGRGRWQCVWRARPRLGMIAWRL
jgi:hypothetical protein